MSTLKILIRKQTTFIIAILALFIGATSCSEKSELIEPDNQTTGSLKTVDVGTLGSGQTGVILYAGQTINSGTVSFLDIDTDNNGEVDALQVTYATTDGWELMEIHFWIGNSLSTMPQTNSGNPKIGLFPYNFGNLNGLTSYSFVIPFTTLGFQCPGPEDYFVAAHASLRKSNGSGGYQTETGWGDGQRLVNKGNWAMYFTIYITCDGTEPPVTSTCETAFAYGSQYASCFSNFPEFLDNPNRWGWTNGALSNGIYTFDVYAAAGQCDLSKGTKVGTLTVNYQGSTVTLTLNISGTNPVTGLAYSLEEIHFYAGNELFPRTQQGNFTVAPGKYPHIASDLNGATNYTYTFNNMSGDIYVIAHAVVCGFPQE